MIKNRVRGIILFVCFGWMVPGVGALPMEISTQEADVILRDETAITAIEAGGDFNGDGFDDIALFGEGTIRIVLGGNLPRDGNLDEWVDVRISPVTGDMMGITAADIDGDGKDDLIVIPIQRFSTPHNVRVFYGQEALPTFFDFSTPDLTLIGKTNSLLGVGFAVGDVDGDGKPDMLIGAPKASSPGRSAAGEAYLIHGRDERRVGTFNVTTSTEVVTFRGPHQAEPLESNLGTWVGFGEINLDGKQELFLSSRNESISASETVMISGRPWEEFPALWDFLVTTTAVSLQGESFYRFRGSGLVDMDGDERTEFVFSTYTGNGFVSKAYSILKGVDLYDALRGAISVIDFNPASSAYRAPILVGDSWHPPLLGDFDGDDRGDLLIPTYYELEFSYSLGKMKDILLSLGRDLPVIAPATFSSPSVKTLPGLGQFGSYSLGDINGDGLIDLVIVSLQESQRFLTVVYGFRPLTNPAGHFHERQIDSPVAKLELSVDGDPDEMRLSGDLDEDWRDQWVPFQSVVPIRLSSEPEEKKVRVTFRNRLKRESLTVEASAGELTPGVPQTQIRTNVLRVEHGSAGRATIDCHVTERTRIKAVVFDRRGNRLLELIDEERGPGIWPVEWNGLNSAGRRVGAGIYFVVVEANGRREKHKIVVRG
jgi:hypothetical protein